MKIWKRIRKTLLNAVEGNPLLENLLLMGVLFAGGTGTGLLVIVLAGEKSINLILSLSSWMAIAWILLSVLITAKEYKEYLRYKRIEW